VQLFRSLLFTTYMMASACVFGAVMGLGFWLPYRAQFAIARSWARILFWVLKLLRPIAINRGEGHRAVNQVIEQGKSRLKDGLWIVIFPEGTRVVAGDTRKFGVSGAMLSIASGKSVVPVSHNAGTFWPR